MEADAERSANHVSSGKLSASMLYAPLQHQVLKTIGVPQKPLDEYVIRKFKRGQDAEEWLVRMMIGVVDTQKFVEYKNAVGYVDAIVDTADYEFKLGVIPHEVKSTSNAKFRNIMRQVKPDTGHQWQACFYALALGADHFAIDYIAADDYRLEVFIYPTGEFAQAVENAISEYDKAMEDYKANGTIPLFVPREAWQGNPMYNNYPEFMNLNQEQLQLKVKEVMTPAPEQVTIEETIIETNWEGDRDLEVVKEVGQL